MVSSGNLPSGNPFFLESIVYCGKTLCCACSVVVGRQGRCIARRVVVYCGLLSSSPVATAVVCSMQYSACPEEVLSVEG